MLTAEPTAETSCNDSITMYSVDSAAESDVNVSVDHEFFSVAKTA